MECGGGKHGDYQDRKLKNWPTLERSACDNLSSPTLTHTQNSNSQKQKIVRSKDFDQRNKVLFWFDILSNAEKGGHLFRKDQKIRISSQSREHLFSVWLKDEEECKIVVDGDKEIVLELPKDMSMETTCDIGKTIVKTR